MKCIALRKDLMPSPDTLNYQLFSGLGPAAVPLHFKPESCLTSGAFCIRISKWLGNCLYRFPQIDFYQEFDRLSLSRINKNHKTNPKTDHERYIGRNAPWEKKKALQGI